MRMRVTLGALIHQLAAAHGDRPAITQAETGETITYRAFDKLANRIGRGLLQLDGKPGIDARANHNNARANDNDGRYVGVMHENSINYLAATYALKKINRVEVSINRAFRGAALAHMINLTKCRLLLTSAAHFDALDDIQNDLPHLRALILTSGADEAARRFSRFAIADFSAMLADDDRHIPSDARDTDAAAIMFTSGSTGASKGCILSHRYAVRTAENLIPPFRLGADDASYAPYPLSHVGAAYYDILPMLMTGGRAIIRDGFSASAFWREVADYGATWFMCLGSVQQLLYAAPPSPLDRAHKVRRAWATPAPVPKADFDARFNLHLLPGGGYGSTDAGWVVAPQWNHPGGIVLPHFEVAIVDENDDPVPAGGEGEMVIRPREPGIMADGYFGMDGITAHSRRNLWFHTGDIGRMDDAGRFYFVCRMAERIRVKGEMVSAFEVEEGALSHPSVEDAAAIGIPSPDGEENIRLFVTLKAEAKADDTTEAKTDDDAEAKANDSAEAKAAAAAIRAHCQKVMAKFMVPADIVITDKMPRTPTGKIAKADLAGFRHRQQKT